MPTARLVALALTASLAACAGNASNMDRFRTSVYGYADGVRWKNYKAAARFLPPERQAEFLRSKEADRESIDVVDFEIRDVKHVDAEHAAVDVDFSWRAADDPVVRSVRLRQRWQRVGKAWMLMGQDEIEKPKAKPRKSSDLF